MNLKKVEINNKEYVFAPLTIKVIKNFDEIIKELELSSPLKQAEIIINLAVTSLKRANPELDITADKLEEEIDFLNLQEIMSAITEVSGLTAAKEDKKTAKK